MAQADELRGLVQQLFRKFGALGSDVTSCGKPLSIAHGHALMLLLDRPDLTQQDLAAELCIDKSNVARLCAKMVDAGHAVQVAGAEDRRSRVVSLTPAGRRLALEVSAASRQRFEAVLARLNATQRPEVIRALRQLVTAIDASPARTEESADR